MSCPSIYSKVKSVFCLFIIFVGFGLPVLADGAKNLSNELNAGKLLYHAAMNRVDSVSDWLMEGPGQVSFKDGWMHMQSPNEEMHHVFWCPKRFPENFIAQWEAQNMETDAGLCIVFFAAAGLDGQRIFSEELPKRDGNFKQYTKGKIRCYHTSYYANAAHNPDRQQTNLRKNPGFHLVREGEEGIPTESEDIHTITLAKEGSHIRLWVDERKVIDWTDEGKVGGRPHGDGYIGFRQMQWTHFRYRDFRVWAVEDSETPNINSTSAEEDQKPESNGSTISSVPAFPGAQGFGSDTPGGRGGRVIAVTSLEAEGPGSFREACEADGPRIVIFRVGGTIAIENKIVIQNPFITIAGQTAPGDGICIRGAALQIATHDVIVRGLRIRIGDGPGPEPGNRDALAIANRSTQPYNIIIDHCSL
ncbi:DUF1961 family protein, partial [bacterium]|nr:DUF1961 family protein [bacterium]